MKKFKDLSFIALISEDGKKLSVGRISFWICFIISIYYWWVLLIDIPSTLMQTLTTLLLYNVFKKGLNGYFASKTNTSEISTYQTTVNQVPTQDPPAPRI